MNTGARSGIVCLGVTGYLVCDRVGKHEPQADRPVRRVRAVWEDVLAQGCMRVCRWVGGFVSMSVCVCVCVTLS